MADEKSTNEPQGQAEGAGAVPTFLTDPVQQQLPGTPAAPAPAALNNPRADIAALNKLEMHLYAHRYAQTGISSYGSSIDPEAATADRGEAQAILEAEDKELLCSDETGRLLDRLSTMEDLLTDTQVDQVRILKRDRSRLADVPDEVQADFTRLSTEADAVWRRAKVANDWASFEPYLRLRPRVLQQLLQPGEGHRRPAARRHPEPRQPHRPLRHRGSLRRRPPVGPRP